MLTIGSFAVGIRRLSTLAGRGLSVDLFPLLTLAALPPALSCARNGQSTLIMTATMLLATVELAVVDSDAVEPANARSKSARLWLATLWLSLSLAFKPLALPMLLLVGALDRRMAWRLVLGVAAVLAFPFLFQSSHYVVSQYGKSLEMLRASSHCGMIELWAQPFSVLGSVGVNISEGAQTLVRMAAAVVTLVLCWQAQRRHATPRAMEYLFSFSALYILLFNLRTENNTYAMLGPAIGLFTARWIVLSRHRIAVAFLSLLVLFLAAGDELVRRRRLRESTSGSSPAWRSCSWRISSFICSRNTKMPTKTPRREWGQSDFASRTTAASPSWPRSQPRTRRGRPAHDDHF